ncbi:MAG: DUF1499 domain-containing protein [Gammaproteobacteria bacterium]|nr:DUF1499 domain-containing protein [Gammaproteobacteria bacterium]
MSVSKRMSKTALLGLIVSVIAIAVSAMAVLGYRGGTLHFVLAIERFTWGAYLAGTALFLSLLGLWFSRPRGVCRGLFPALLGLVLALPLVWSTLWFEYAAHAYPPINDISTDTEDPPSFWDVPNAVAYPGEEVAKLQQWGYPELKPLYLSMDTEQAFPLASVVARDMGWEIVAENNEELQIEAVDSSLLFGFKDNVVIRLQDVDGKTQVDVRSHSRLGKIDRGANAKRIKAYLLMLGKRVSASGS